MKAKFLLKNLGMENLSDFNDLYTYQDLCILLETFEIY